MLATYTGHFRTLPDGFAVIISATSRLLTESADSTLISPCLSMKGDPETKSFSLWFP